MGLMKEKDILDFVNDLVNAIADLEWVSTADMVIRYGDFKANLDSLIGVDNLKERFESAECNLEEYKEDKYTDIFLTCEGMFYEMAYLADMGEYNEVGKMLDEITGKYGLTIELCGGALGFQCEESWENQLSGI